ncbi:MAG: nucleotidyltransferase domain-containing protein [Bacillus sp. (in: firmicutes)]
MKETILKKLRQVEEDYDVKILYACESGSRAWGFPSKDSDYDVRFIYVHKVEHYLSIDPVGIGLKRDVIELPINDLLDITGWELTKALKLFRKSNPPLLEWLQSSIVYKQAYPTITQLQQLMKTTFAPQACIYHYLNMANNNFREYLKGEEVKIKKYFYVLRPVLAARWIEQFNEFPPLEFQTLLEKNVPKGALKEEMMILLQRKLAGDELDIEPRIELISHFLDEEIPRLQHYAKSLKKHASPCTEQLDELFRATVTNIRR